MDSNSTWECDNRGKEFLKDLLSTIEVSQIFKRL